METADGDLGRGGEQGQERERTCVGKFLFERNVREEVGGHHVTCCVLGKLGQATHIGHPLTTWTHSALSHTMHQEA